MLFRSKGVWIMNNKDLIKCIQAEEEGKDVQCKAIDGSRWGVKGTTGWLTGQYEYRIKPQPKEIWVKGAFILDACPMDSDFIHYKEVIE